MPEEIKKNEVTPASHRIRHPTGPRFRTVRLHRVGNSWGVYIPKKFAAQLGMGHMSEAKLYVVGEVICIQPLTNETFLPGVIAVRQHSVPDVETE